jgi:glycine/D-amino acid oxidase-like deaminating enzyme
LNHFLGANSGDSGNYRDSGNLPSGDSAGPDRTSPFGLKREPWHGQSQVDSASFQSTLQPDTDVPYHYARWTPDSRLILGGEDEPRKPTGDRRTTLNRHARTLASLFPPLTEIEPEYAWEGLFATTPDGLPNIGTHRRYPRQLFALGYGGNGMTFGYMAAEILARYVLGKETGEDRFFGFGR